MAIWSGACVFSGSTAGDDQVVRRRRKGMLGCEPVVDGDSLGVREVRNQDALHQAGNVELVRSPRRLIRT